MYLNSVCAQKAEKVHCAEWIDSTLEKENVWGLKTKGLERKRKHELVHSPI